MNSQLFESQGSPTFKDPLPATAVFQIQPKPRPSLRLLLGYICWKICTAMALDPRFNSGLLSVWFIPIRVSPKHRDQVPLSNVETVACHTDLNCAIWESRKFYEKKHKRTPDLSPANSHFQRNSGTSSETPTLSSNHTHFQAPGQW